MWTKLDNYLSDIFEKWYLGLDDFSFDFYRLLNFIVCDIVGLLQGLHCDITSLIIVNSLVSALVLFNMGTLSYHAFTQPRQLVGHTAWSCTCFMDKILKICTQIFSWFWGCQPAQSKDDLFALIFAAVCTFTRDITNPPFCLQILPFCNIEKRKVEF